MIKTKIEATGDVWRDLKGAQSYFGCGRWTVEKLATESDSKRKIGKKVLFNIQRMSEWLDKNGEKA